MHYITFAIEDGPYWQLLQHAADGDYKSDVAAFCLQAALDAAGDLMDKEDDTTEGSKPGA